jgi:hypothetical protein
MRDLAVRAMEPKGLAFTLAAVGWLVFGACSAAHANWLSSLVRESAEVAGGAAGRAGRAAEELVPLRTAATYLDRLNDAPKGALAAHATPEGHWQFVNRDGQTFTVGTPDEMKRVLPTLVPDLVPGDQTKMTLYLSEDSVFANKAALDEIPRDADLYVVTDGAAYPIARSGKGADAILTARLTPNLAMELVDQSLFDETAFLLGRPLNKSNVRTIAFEPGAGVSLSSSPKLDVDSKVPLVDQLDPNNLGNGLRPIRGQTALVTGRIDNGKLMVAPSTGSDIALSIDDLVAAAQHNDVNLIILQSDSSRQAGGRNWLWQKIKVGGLGEATEKASFGDFLDALAARRGGFLLTASRDGASRVHIAAVPDLSSAGLSSDASHVVEELVSHVTGEVITNAVNIDARDRDTETERDARLIPWLPAGVQYSYLAGLIVGLVSWATVRKWWLKLLAMASRGAPQNARSFGRIVSELIFVLVFMPIAGLPAFAVQAIHHLIQTILAPFRWIRRRFLLRHV